MLRYVHGYDEEVSAFVAHMIPSMHGRGFGECKTIGVVRDDGEMIAGIVYHNWNPQAGVIEMSAAAIPGSRWFTRRTADVMYEYPFVQLDCQMIMQLTPADDERLLGQLARGGYMFVLVPRLLGRDQDGVLCLFTREMWIDNKILRFKPKLEEAA